MFGKNAMKYPALVAGIIMFAIFLSDPKTKSWWGSIKGRYIPNTCRALIDRVSEHQPDNWSMECPGTSKMILTVASEHSSDEKNLRTLTYRTMANTLKSFAVMANPETLINLHTFEVLIEHEDFEVLGRTDGQALTKLRSIEGQNKIAQHLRLTVKVKEQFK